MAHILIIEDDRAIARIEKDYLEMSGFSVTLAEDGETGCRAALTGQFDLILLDVMLPGMDGFTVLQTLRDKLDVPILLVTARTEDLDKIRGLGLGADDYIEKPFSPSVLVARIRANLNQYARLKQGDRDRQLRAGDLTLDPRSRRVFLAEQEVALKNKEYELLLFFMRNPGMVFDRETLYERVWGLEAMGDSATVAVHINRLREKLGEQFIQTVRGAGYRFSAE
ncbi:MAG: response regulator transcription factor [Clostridia bacterium]|nr:response regulator transcription factor [Clostridia bacterium]